jgi:hypothetical protein
MVGFAIQMGNSSLRKMTHSTAADGGFCQTEISMKCMPCLVLVLVLVVVSSPVAAKVTALAPEERAALETGAADVHLLFFIKDLPKAVREACGAATSDHEFRIADNDEKYQETDVVVQQGLPQRHFLWAAEIPGHYLVYYELGGFSHSYHVVLMTADGSGHKATVVWSAVAEAPMPSYSAFLAALDDGTLDDSLNYSH